MAVNFGGHKLALNIGALEEIEEVSPCIVILRAFVEHCWTLKEVRVILDQALIASGKDGVTSGNLIEKHGLSECKNAANDLLVEAFGLGEKKPAKDRAKKAGS